MNDSKTHPAASAQDAKAAESQPGVRMYVHEPGWRVSIKRGSERAFCYMMAPGQDYYHRLQDGELFLQQAEERVCLACAARRGIISYDARRLRDESPKFLADSGEMPIFVLGVDEHNS